MRGLALLAVAFCRWAFVGLLALPLAWLCAASFLSDRAIISNRLPSLDGFTLANWLAFFRFPGGVSAAANSTMIAFGVAVAVLAVAAPVAYALSHSGSSFPLSNLLLGLVVGTEYLIAPAVLILAYHPALASLGLVNTILGISLLHFLFCFPFGLLALRMAFRSIPQGLIRQSHIDGGRERVVFWRIALPLIRPYLISIAILSFAVSWKEYLYAFIVTFDGRSRTLPVLVASLYGGEARQWGLLAVCGLLLLVPGVVVGLALSARRTLSLPGMATRG